MDILCGLVWLVEFLVELGEDGTFDILIKLHKETFIDRELLHGKEIVIA